MKKNTSLLTANAEKISESLYQDIRAVLHQAKQTAFKAANFSMVCAYWTIGKLIVERDLNGEARAEYGKAVLETVAEKLSKEFGKSLDARELRRIRQFYLQFQIRDALRPELSWNHYRQLLKVKDEKARLWYMNEAADSAWGYRQLSRQISVLYYERLICSKNKASLKEEAKEKLASLPTTAVFRDPYMLDFLGLSDYPALHENIIEQALIDNLQNFLLELGRGFCFVARQKRMQYDDEDFYIDLVFYHSVLKCHVLIDLKLGKLTHQDIGQMDSYIRMFDDLYKNPDDNPTLGLILCSEKNEAVVRYSVLSEYKQIFASKYELELPAESVLRQEIQKERLRVEQTQLSNSWTPSAEKPITTFELLLLKQIRKNPRVTYDMLVKKLNVSRSKVYRTISELQKQGRLKRICYPEKKWIISIANG